MTNARKRDPRIPRRPFLWLAAALLFTLPPLFGALAAWVPALFLVTLAAKLWMEPRGYRLRLMVWKLIFGALLIVAVYLSYGTLQGIEPGISLIVALTSLKILEAHTAREFQVMVMVGWLLCLCGFVLSQDLAVAASEAIAFALLLVALADFHLGPSFASTIRSARVAARILAQALPLLVILFLLFPRITTGFRMQLFAARTATAGFSDQLAPGSIASLASSSEIAFRAEFPDDRFPAPGAMYWRGVVLVNGDGFSWRGLGPPASLPRPARPLPAGGAIRHWITLEPNNEHWMFALDRPVAAPAGAILAPGNYLWSSQPIRKPRRYEVTSFPELREKELPPRERKIALAVPHEISPAVRALAESWRAGNPEPRTIVTTALRYFRTQGFRYSTTPGAYQESDLDGFLFHRRRGFCEHYAATFATLMRLAGVPSRVVVGYLGGEFNQYGHFFVVRQADTHAWCEVWIPGNGWLRVDPTSVVAPDRVNLGLGTFLARREAAGNGNNSRGRSGTAFGQRPIFTDLRLAWETLNYTWDTRVLSFDADAQNSFFTDLGWNAATPFTLLALALGLAAALLAIYTLLMRLRARRGGDRVKLLYDRFCQKAARLGVVRPVWEGPSAFAARVQGLLPNESQHAQAIRDSYIALRYAPAPRAATLNQLERAVQLFAHEKPRRNHTATR